LPGTEGLKVTNPASSCRTALGYDAKFEVVWSCFELPGEAYQVENSLIGCLSLDARNSDIWVMKGDMDDGSIGVPNTTTMPPFRATMGMVPHTDGVPEVETTTPVAIIQLVGVPSVVLNSIIVEAVIPLADRQTVTVPLVTPVTWT